MSISVEYDGEFDLATAKSSNSVNWRNRQVSWKDFLTKVSKTHYTHETQSEYLNSAKEDQDRIKNIGGYVGGILSNGSRKKGNVLHRQLITLDIDHLVTQDFWLDFTLMYGNAACIYSTHKHSPDKPRLRLILPLNRPVFADEYEAITRRIAGVLDINTFDDSTFQAERLMYWPSTSKDAEFVFEYQDGEWLDADAVLASYTNWNDCSEWPVCDRVDGLMRRDMVKQGDPTSKPGVIGAWCRTHTITDVLENYLQDTYEPTDVSNRYSYKEGSTGAGLIVYDDLFAYSHHGSDPVSGKLSNAFDLVRVHKFGLRDDKTGPETPITQHPSYLAMVEFASQDDEVKAALVTERMAKAKGDFNEVEVDEVVNDEAWIKKLDVSEKSGKVQNTINNVLLIFENDPYLKNKIAFDDFEKCEVALCDLPWRDIDHSTRRLVDKDDANMRHYLEDKYKISSLPKTKDAMDVLSQKTSFHPVKEYLKGLKWDGVKRVDELFIDYMGCADNAYTRAVTRKSLCAACARVFRPGIKYDTMVVFVGVQGMNKSELIKRLGKLWFSDSFNTVHGNASIEQLQGVWLVEMAELSGLKQADVESIKSYITRTVDRYRVAYGRRVENFPRQCIFFGSTNKKRFLKDKTGNRRFWPLSTNEANKTKQVFEHLTEEEVDQIWAEAYQLYLKKEPLYLSEDVMELAIAVQEEHSSVDEREGQVIKYINALLPTDWNERDVFSRRGWLQQSDSNDSIEMQGSVQRSKVCVSEIWCEGLGQQQKDLTNFQADAIHDIMRSQTGWEEVKEDFKYYGTAKGYRRVGGVSDKFESKQLKKEEWN